MKLHIIISSAVVLEEKNKVKACLFEMERDGLLSIGEVYDCNDHSTTLSGGMSGPPKQENIDEIIHHSDWFICLAPESHVGLMTMKEIKSAAETLRTRPLVISLFHPNNPIKTSDTTNKVSISEVNKHFNNIVGVKTDQYWVSYQYDSKHENLITELKKEFIKLEKDLKFPCQRLSAYARKGVYILPKDLFYDTHRSDPRYGYNGDFYIRRRSVDENLEQKLKNVNYKFVFITGRPSSGKSRAMLECLHGELKNELVVVMNRDNATDICLNLQHEITLDTELQRRGKNFTMGQIHYFFVADQVRDVLQTVSDDIRRQFLKNVAELPNLTLLGTSTPQPLVNFLDDYKDVISRLDIDGNSTAVDIPLLSHDSESSAIMANLRQQYQIDTGETIGDFIPALKGYKEHVTKRLLNKAQEEDFIYLPTLLSSLQLVMTFRHTTPLFLAVMLLRNKNNHDDENTFAKGCTRCINFLLEQNVIWVNDIKGGEIRLLDYTKDFTFNKFFTKIYDDEEFENIVSIDLVFTVNELIWEHMLQTDESRQSIKFFYNLFTIEGIQEAFRDFFTTFPTAASLRRLLPRIPKQGKWLDRQGYEQRMQTIWAMARNLVDKIDRRKQQEKEMKNLYFMLIGRAYTVEQVDGVLDKMQKEGYCIDANIIGEMYYFSRRLTPGTPEYETFLARIESYEVELGKGPATLEDIYRLSQHINARNLTFSQAQQLTNDVIVRLVEQSPSGKLFRGLDAVVEECRNETSLIRRNLEFLLGVFARLCNSVEDVKKLASIYHRLQFYPTPYALHCMASHFQDADSITAVIDILMPTLLDCQQNEKFYKQFIGSTLKHLNSLSLSTWLCDKMMMDLGTTVIDPQLISLCLQNCQEHEFQKAVAYVKTLPQNLANAIVYNNLIRLAPTVDDTYFVLGMMPDGFIDDFTLCNCLSRVREYANRHGGKKNDSLVSHNIFHNAYEFINHPRLKPFRTHPACLTQLFSLATNKEQDAYVCHLLQPSEQYLLTKDTEICTSRIMKCKKNGGFRTFVETFDEIYIPAYHAMPTAGKLSPDLFNAMCSVWQIAKDRHDVEANKRLKKLINDIDGLLREDRLIQDGHFFLNYHVKMKGFKIFNDDGTQVTKEFMQWFIGKKGNADFSDEKLLERMVQYFFNREKVPIHTTWNRLRTLYSLFHEEFEKMKITSTTFSVLMIAFLKLKINGLATKADIDFLDYELTVMHPKRDKGLKSAIRQLAQQGVFFTYDTLYPEPANIHAHHNMKIDETETIADIITILKDEYRDCGFVTPSTINKALFRVKDIMKAKKKTKSQYEFIKIFIYKNQLLDILTARSYCLLALLANKKEDMEMWLSLFDKASDISIISFGELGAERKIYDYLGIETSRRYFHKWVSSLREFYDTNTKLAKNLPESSWATLGRHLRLELNALELLNSNDMDEQKDIAETLAFIVSLYSMSSFIFPENNFSFNTTPNNLIDFLERLTPQNQNGLTWKEMQVRIEKKGWYSSSDMWTGHLLQTERIERDEKTEESVDGNKRKEANEYDIQI